MRSITTKEHRAESPSLKTYDMILVLRDLSARPNAGLDK